MCLFGQGILTKTLLGAENSQYYTVRGASVMRKTFPASAFILALLLSAVVGTLFSSTAHANPYNWETIPPPAGTKAPTITLLTPENNTVFPVNNVLLNFVANVGNSTASYQRVFFLVNYKADWQQNETIKPPIQDDNNDGLVNFLSH